MNLSDILLLVIILILAAVWYRVNQIYKELDIISEYIFNELFGENDNE